MSFLNAQTAILLAVSLQQRTAIEGFCVLALRLCMTLNLHQRAQFALCVLTCVRFKFSEATGRTNMKLITIDHYSEAGVVKEFAIFYKRAPICKCCA